MLLSSLSSNIYLANAEAREDNTQETGTYRSLHNGRQIYFLKVKRSVLVWRNVPVQCIDHKFFDGMALSFHTIKKTDVNVLSILLPVMLLNISKETSFSK